MSSLAALRRDYGTSADAETNGVWVDIPVDSDHKVEFLIARMSRSNRRWASKATRVYKHNKAKVDRGNFADQEALIEQSLKVFCETVLLDWRGVTNEDGTVLAYTPEAGIKLLTELPDLYDYASEQANAITTFQTEQMKAIVGESKATTSGG